MTNLNQKTLLICGNGMSGEIIPTIKKWGYRILVITEFCNDVGLEHADKVINANSKKPQKALDAAAQLYKEGERFNGVISLCWDCPISVSLIAEKFNLRSIPTEVAVKSSNKELRSDAFSQYGVRAPKYKVISKLSDLDDFVLPIVLKPMELSSSKGVILVEDKNDLFEAYNYTKSFDEEKKSVIANEFIEGTEHSTEGFMINGKLFPTGISDRVFKYQECKPYFVEVGDILPTELDETVVSQCFIQTEKAALALGIKDGVVKGDLICSSSKKVYVLELTPRLGGPRFGTEIIPLCNGTNILKALVQYALGEKIDKESLEIKFNRGVVARSIFPVPGRIKSIHGLDNVKNLPGYYDFKWWGITPMKKNDIVNKYTYGCGDVGYFICTGEDRGRALNNADTIEKNIIIETI